VSNLIFKDAGKAFFGSVVAVSLALFLPLFVHSVADDAEPVDEAPAEVIVDPQQTP